jgi:hypothetical protein
MVSYASERYQCFQRKSRHKIPESPTLIILYPSKTGVGLSVYQAVELGPPLPVVRKASTIHKFNKPALLIFSGAAKSVAMRGEGALISSAVTCSASLLSLLLFFGHPALVQTHYTRAASDLDSRQLINRNFANWRAA